MRLTALADALTRLEGTSRRNDAVRIVADLLTRLSQSERPAVIYLLQGQLRPPYEGIELGVGERMLVRALARAYGTTETIVTRRLRRTGDLGVVAESLAATTSRRSRGLTVRQAYDAMLAIARAGGSGSLERKTRRLLALLGRATPREARYLVRIAQGRLRLGIGDATVVEAVATAALGDRRKKGVVEAAYNVRSDLGAVAQVAFARGARGLARIAPQIGVPIRPALAQRLPSADAIIGRLGTVQAEPKYDGLRLQLHRDGERVWAFSRRLENVTAQFPEIAAGARRQLRVRRAILDGEAVVIDPKTGRFLPFQVTMTRKRRHGVAAAARRYPLRLFAFDVMLADGRNLMPRPQRERSARLAAIVRVRPRSTIAVTEWILTTQAAELQAYFRTMLRRGLEGIIAKRPDAPYRAGARAFDWVKLKRSYQTRLRDTVDLVIVGYFAGRGKRAKLGIGSLLAAVYDPEHDRLRTVAKIGSGASEAEWRALRAQLDRAATTSRPRRVDSLIEPDVWVEPRYVVEVIADEITRSPLHTSGKSGTGPGYALRFPRLVNGIRHDKGPAEATTEREILELYRQQHPATVTR
jgi:DNA ligase-1